MKKNHNKQTRREFLSTSTAFAAGALLASGGRAYGQNKPMLEQKSRRKRTIRFAHLTDIHLDDKNHAPDGFAQVLHHVQNLADKPELIITGGDMIMESLRKNNSITTAQWSLFKQILSKECSLPVKHCIGNHDVWGWDKVRSKTTGNEPNWGKARAMQELELSERYYSFTKGKWHFIILDSIYPVENDFIAKIDEQQFGWLENQLINNSDSYICIISHVPILSAVDIYARNCEESGQWVVRPDTMHIDSRRLKDLFLKNKSLKLCISGHLHMLERVVYENLTYICDGAVCSGWWKGKFQGTNEGYGLFDLYDDGSFEHHYTTYGWTHH
ncbi:MAG: metallophosphoesterase [Sedimentisphaerales bacterium]|nr:metallophosphoesterase [Sedimentisphaerales bacterium]